jgi:DNA-binding XRE family transcriptional regulator
MTLDILVKRLGRRKPEASVSRQAPRLDAPWRANSCFFVRLPPSRLDSRRTLPPPAKPNSPNRSRSTAAAVVRLPLNRILAICSLKGEPMKINGAVLKKIREGNLISASKLASLSNISMQTIYLMERGKQVKIENIRKVLEGLELTLDDARAQGLIIDD